MKVCYVTHKSNLTGANRSLLDLLDGLDRDVVEPCVLVGRKGPLLKELQQRGIPYCYAFIPPTLNSDRRILNLLKTILNTEPVNRLGIWSCKRVFRRLRPDLVHNNTMLCSVGMQAAKEMRIPYVCHFREFVWEDHHRKWLKPDRVEALIDHAALPLSISDSVKKKMQPLSRKEILVLQDGIRTDHYLLPCKELFETEEIHLLLAGRIIEGKGQMEAIKAVHLAGKKTDRPLILHLAGSVGDYSYFENLQEYIERNRLSNIVIEPFIDDLRDLRRMCDIGLTCSVFEGLGRVTIESMLSCMLPIASDTAGSAEIITDHETGLLYKAGHPEELAKKILWAIEHPAQSNEIVKNAQEYARVRYDYKTYSKELTDLYLSVLQKS